METSLDSSPVQLFTDYYPEFNLAFQPSDYSIHYYDSFDSSFLDGQKDMASQQSSHYHSIPLQPEYVTPTEQMASTDFEYQHHQQHHPFTTRPTTSGAAEYHHSPPDTRTQNSQDLMYSHPTQATTQGKTMFVERFRAEINPTAGKEGITPYGNMMRIEFEKASDILADPAIDDYTIFSDLQDAADWRSEQCNDHLPIDNTVPKIGSPQRACVKLLFKAFKSTCNAVDNEPMIAPFRSEKHDNRRVEAMCWDLLTALIRRAEVGPLLSAYDPQKVTNTCELHTFADRLDAVVDVLSQYKTICKHLFDAPYINTFVDDPVRAKNRVESNKRLNAEKGKTMAIGKAHRRNGVSPLSGRASATPAKRRRRNNTSVDDDDIEVSSATAIGSPSYSNGPSPNRVSRCRSRSTRLVDSTPDVATPRSGLSSTTTYYGSPIIKDEVGSPYKHSPTPSNMHTPMRYGGMPQGTYYQIAHSASPFNNGTMQHGSPFGGRPGNTLRPAAVADSSQYQHVGLGADGDVHAGNTPQLVGAPVFRDATQAWGNGNTGA